MTEEIKAKAFAMFAEGESVNKVAGALFRNYWAAAKKMHAAWLSETGQRPAQGKTATKRGGRVTAVAELDPEPEAYELTVNVPIDRVDAIFAALTVQEKMDAIQAVLQTRVSG